MLDANVTRFPFIFFNLSGCRILLATTSPLRGAIYVVSFLWKRCVKRGNIVAEANVSQFATPGNICCGSKICFPGRKIVCEFIQKNFASSANVSSFVRRGKFRETMFPFTTFPRFSGAFTGF